MKPTKLIAIIIFGFVFMQLGCSKDPINERLLSDGIKSQNPYHENDKLYFVSDSSQKFVFQVSFRTTEIFEYLSAQAGPEYLVELDKTLINFLDSVPEWGIYMEMDGYSSELSINVSNQLKNISGGHLTSFRFALPLSKQSPEYIDSVYVNGSWHYKVYIQEKEKIESYVYKLYYSTELGIIKIEFSDDRTWELEKIE